MLTGVCLNPSRDLTRSDIVKKGDILTKNRGEIGFAETFCANFRRVSPDGHVDDVRNEHGDTWEED